MDLSTSDRAETLREALQTKNVPVLFLSLQPNRIKTEIRSCLAPICTAPKFQKLAQGSSEFSHGMIVLVADCIKWIEAICAA
jgi:hypothetical protein